MFTIIAFQFSVLQIEMSYLSTSHRDDSKMYAHGRDTNSMLGKVSQENPQNVIPSLSDVA